MEMREIVHDISEADFQSCEILSTSSSLIYITWLLCVMTPEDRVVVFPL